MSRKCQNSAEPLDIDLHPGVEPEDQDLHHHDDHPEAAEEDMEAVQRHQREEGGKKAAAGRQGAVGEHRRKIMQFQPKESARPEAASPASKPSSGAVAPPYFIASEAMPKVKLLVSSTSVSMKAGPIL